MKKAKRLIGWTLLMGIIVFGFTAAALVTFEVLSALEDCGWYLQVAVPMFVGVSLMSAVHFACIELIDYLFDKNVFY